MDDDDAACCCALGTELHRLVRGLDDLVLAVRVGNTESRLREADLIERIDALSVAIKAAITDVPRPRRQGDDT